MDLNQTISKVVKFCNQKLLKDEEALKYLENRKINLNSVNQFEIGLFPQDLRDIFKIVEPKFLRDANIVKNASKSVFQTWDLITPIKDVYGDYIAIAGRTRLNEEDRDTKKIPKYINSVYKKSQHLFGLNLAKYHILDKNIAYCVEGYYDVISPFQAGINNVVGVCGKYLSVRQIALLARYTSRIVLVLDNEADAQAVANKIATRRQYAGVSVIAKNPFPDGIKDLDQFVRERDVQEVVASLKEREDFSIETLW